MARPVAFIGVVLLVFGALTFAQDQAPKTDVSGVYQCEGKNPDGSPYKGMVEIAAVGDTYLVRWQLSNRVEVWGVGIYRHDTLSVSYFGGTPAIAVYNKQGNRLIGEWTMGGAEGEVFSETLTLDPAAAHLPRPRREPREDPDPVRPSGSGLRL